MLANTDKAAAVTIERALGRSSPEELARSKSNEPRLPAKDWAQLDLEKEAKIANANSVVPLDAYFSDKATQSMVDKAV